VNFNCLFPKQTNFSEVPELAAEAVALSILLKQSKGIQKKNKNLPSGGRFQQANLTFAKTSQMQETACETSGRVSSLPSHQVWLYSEASLNWQLVWYEMLLSPHLKLFHASQSGRFFMEAFVFHMLQKDGGICCFYNLSSRKTAFFFRFCHFKDHNDYWRIKGLICLWRLKCNKTCFQPILVS